jgi:Flp pilus assembly protein TadG
VFGLFVFVLYALIAFGMILALKQSMTSAASDGARAAIAARPVGAETPAQAQVRVAKAKVDNALNWLGSKYHASDTTAVVAFCSGSSGPQCITVTVDYPYESRPLVPPSPGMGLMTPSHIKSTAVVQVS